MLQLRSPLSDYLRPGDTVLDLGANIGELARQFAHDVGPTGTVVCVEPDPVSVERGKRETSTFPQVCWMQAAVAASAGPVLVYVDRDDRRRNSCWSKNRIDQGLAEPFAVDGVTLDALTASLPSLRVIKVDVQGSEAAMLTGATETLQNRRLTWYVELWPAGLREAGSSVREVCDRFAAHGWRPASGTWAKVIQSTEGLGWGGSVDVTVLA